MSNNERLYRVIMLEMGRMLETWRAQVGLCNPPAPAVRFKKTPERQGRRHQYDGRSLFQRDRAHDILR